MLYSLSHPAVAVGNACCTTLMHQALHEAVGPPCPPFPGLPHVSTLGKQCQQLTACPACQLRESLQQLAACNAWHAWLLSPKLHDAKDGRFPGMLAPLLSYVQSTRQWCLSCGRLRLVSSLHPRQPANFTVPNWKGFPVNHGRHALVAHSKLGQHTLTVHHQLFCTSCTMDPELRATHSMSLRSKYATGANICLSVNDSRP